MADLITSEERSQLNRDAASIANTGTWYHDWHWKRDRYGYLSVAGMREAREHVKEAAEYHQSKLDAVPGVLERLDAAIAQHEWLVDDDAKPPCPVYPKGDTDAKDD